MTTTTEARPGLYRLLAWLSPSFPIGAFSYSHGLEAVVEAGAIHDRTTLQQWVAAIVAHGSGRTDADILRDTYRAAVAGDAAGVAEANQRGVAYRPTAELVLESSQQGAAFQSTWLAAWVENDPSPPFGGEREGPIAQLWDGEVGPSDKTGSRPGIPHLTPALSAPRGGEGVCLAAAIGISAAQAGIALEDALLGYLHALASNLMSAGLRLGVIGQTDGQRSLAALELTILEASTATLTRDPEDFGSATFALDVASMVHETQYSRLFRS